MQHEEFRDLMAGIDEGVYFVDTDKRITYWNRASERITGYSAQAVTGSRCSDNLLRHVDADGRELCIMGCPLSAAMYGEGIREMDVYLHHRDGHRLPVTVRAAPLKDADGTVLGAVEIFSDRSDRSAMLAELERLRNERLVDPLTGLGNRRYLEIAVEARFRARAAHGIEFGILLLDIDHFKKVNDSYGHPTGDKVLCMVAATLMDASRPLDAAIRWGGEEFILLYPNMTIASLADIAERVRMLVEHSWIDLDDGTRLSVTVSVGGTLSSAGDTLESLTGRADSRLYECKEGGRNRVSIGT
ncbi:MAG: diguanylate cyclase [Rectinemataceae bacterium]